MTTNWSSRAIKASYNRAELYHAVAEKEKEKILEILQYDIDWKHRDNNGDTVLHLAFNRKYNTSRQIIEILEIFLNLGMNVNAKNSSGKTAMHLAIRDKSKDVVEFLLNRGGDLNIRDKHGNSMAHYVVENEFKRFRECVWAYNTPEDRNLLERESVEFIYWLMSKGLDVEYPNNVGVTALELALKRNSQHVLPIFLKYTKNVNFVDEKNRTILHIFLKKNGYYKDFTNQKKNKTVAIPSWFYGMEYAVNIAQILLDKNVSVDIVDSDGNTPLHIAGKMEEPELLQMLLGKFTNVNVRNKQGETVLHVVIDECMDYAGLYFDEYVDVVRTLITKGTDIRSRNGKGFTLVQLAAMQKHFRILQVLKEYNADFSVLTSQGENLLHLVSKNMNEMVSNRTYDKMVDLLVSEGCDVNAVDNDGITPLYVAAEYGSLAIVKKLIEYGAQVDCRENLFQLTALHRAANFGHLNVIEELIKAGANVNAKDTSGTTPLHLAVDEFSEKSVKLLLRLGAHVDAQDKYGRLPLDKAIESDNPAAVEELLKYGADINDSNTLGAIVVLDNSYMYHVLLDHWYKLKAVGLPCVNDYMHYNEDDFKCSRNSFMKEVQELKTSMIDKRVSLYDLLHMNPNQRSFYVEGNSELKEMVNSTMLELLFPRYHTLILASYREGLARKQLLEPAKRAWYKLTNIHLPDICLELILNNLSNVNLRRMVEEDGSKIMKRSSMTKTNKSVKKRKIE